MGSHLLPTGSAGELAMRPSPSPWVLGQRETHTTFATVFAYILL